MEPVTMYQVGSAMAHIICERIQQGSFAPPQPDEIEAKLKELRWLPDLPVQEKNSKGKGAAKKIGSEIFP